MLSGKSMKKLAVTDEIIFYIYKAFDHKNNSHADVRISPTQLLGKHGEEDSKNKVLL